MMAFKIKKSLIKKIIIVLIIILTGFAIASAIMQDSEEEEAINMDGPISRETAFVYAKELKQPMEKIDDNWN